MSIRREFTLDYCLATRPVEEVLGSVGLDGRRLQQLTRALSWLAGEFRQASREFALCHRILVRYNEGVPWTSIGPPEPTDTRLQPLAFAVSSFGGSLPLRDGVGDVMSVLELTRGSSDGLERFHSLVVQTARTVSPPDMPGHELSDRDMFDCWMVDLYRSIRNGLPGLYAQPRVSVRDRGWTAARLSQLDQSDPAGPSFAIDSSSGPESQGWYAELEPECFAASAVKVDAILMALEQAGQIDARREHWRAGAWFRAIVPSLGPDTLRTAKARGKPLRTRRAGRPWQYEVQSVCREWPDHAKVIQEALEAEINTSLASSEEHIERTSAGH